MAGFLNLKAVLNLNASGFQIGLKRAESQAKAFSNEIKSEFAKAFGVATIVGFAKKVIETADQITDLSERLGVSAKALQEWGYAAKKNGAELEDVTRFFEALAVARQRAVDGNEGAINSFEKLGVSMSQLRNGRLEDIGKSIGDAVKGGDVQNLISSLKEIGGKGSTELIPAFKAGLDDMATAAHNAGQVMDNETLVALKALKNEAQALADIFTGPMATALAFMSARLNDVYSLMNLIVGGPSAFFGAIAGGGSIKDALDAELESWDSTMKKWQANKAKLSSAATDLDKPKTGGGATPTASTPSNVMHNFGRVIGESSRPEGLSEWQRLGAAVRQDATTPVLKSIETNTEKTAERIEALNKLLNSQSNSGSGFGGGF